MVGGVMKSYQMESLQWLLNIHVYCERYKAYFRARQQAGKFNPNEYQINSILADEMGLGKTIQALAVLSACYEYFGVRGTHLIVVPKSTLPQWEGEQKKWCPAFSLLSVIGDQEERDAQLAEMLTGKYDLVLTTYDVVNLEFKKFS